MRILLRLAELQGAARFIDVTQAHIDGCIYTGDAILRFAETLADQGGQVSVPTSTNVISVDRRRWREQHVPEEWAGKARRLGDAYLRMGAQPTFTCAPYEGPRPPAFGEHVAWAESNAIAFDVGGRITFDDDDHTTEGA
jgi:predicted aconitase